MSNTTENTLTDAERRVAEREDVIEGALCFVRGRPDAVLCVIRDISETGARLGLKQADVFMPRTFKLSIPEHDLVAECEVMWRNGDELGVRFVSKVVFD